MNKFGKKYLSMLGMALLCVIIAFLAVGPLVLGIVLSLTLCNWWWMLISIGEIITFPLMLTICNEDY